MKVYEAQHGEHTLTVEPVTKDNIHQLHETRKQVTKKNWRLYTNHDPHLAKTLREGPPTPPERGTPGEVFYLIKLDDITVGLSNHTYYHDDKGKLCCRGGLLILQQYQRQGLATTYSHLSVKIAEDDGAHWFHGQTRLYSPMHRVRMKQGWTMGERFRHPNGERFINIKKKLEPKHEEVNK